MRRWACVADGTRWLILTEAEAEERFEFQHDSLRAILEVKQVLSSGEWKALGIHNLRLGHFIRVGSFAGAGSFLPHAKWAGCNGCGRGCTY